MGWNIKFGMAGCRNTSAYKRGGNRSLLEILTTSGSGGYFGVETFQLLPPASPVALSVGAPGQVLTVSGGLPTWQTPSSNGGGNSPFAQITGGLIVANNATDDFVFGSSAQASGSALFHLYGLNAFAGTQPVASIGAKTSYAALVVDNSGVGDLFTASASGATRFTITQNGSIASTGNLTLAGTTGVTLSGNGANLNFTGTGLSTIVTANNQNFAINPGGFGLFGINTDGGTPLANFDIRTNIGTLAVASVSGATSFAALVVDNSGVGDLFTASKSGLPLFTIKNNGNVLLGGANATITAPTGLTLQETGDTYGGVALNLQNRNGVNGAMFQQLGTVDLVDFVFAGLTNQRNIRYENRGGQAAGGLMYQIATPEFEIGAAADPTMMVSDIGVGIRKGGLLIAGSWNTAATFSATLDVRNLFSGTAAIASVSGALPLPDWWSITPGKGDIFTASASGKTRFVITNREWSVWYQSSYSGNRTADCCRCLRCPDTGSGQFL